MWLDESLQWIGRPNRKRGRSPTFSDAAIQCCLGIKCLFGQPLRQALGMVQSLLRVAKLDWPVSDFSTVCRRQSFGVPHLMRGDRLLLADPRFLLLALASIMFLYGLAAPEFLGTLLGLRPRSSFGSSCSTSPAS
jgi:hypothetical protein